MKMQELVEYGKLLSDIKRRVRQGQQRAALSANATMILTYWDIGQMIAQRQGAEDSQRASASRFLQQPAANSASELPNLVHQAILQIPWYHNVILMQKFKRSMRPLWFQRAAYWWSCVA